jgi:hypothetical protein
MQPSLSVPWSAAWTGGFGAALAQSQLPSVSHAAASSRINQRRTADKRRLRSAGPVARERAGAIVTCWIVTRRHAVTARVELRFIIRSRGESLNQRKTAPQTVHKEYRFSQSSS